MKTKKSRTVAFKTAQSFQPPFCRGQNVIKAHCIDYADTLIRKP